jgi:hypothetical protein
VSDTPRTDEAYFEPHATMYDLAGEMKLMERELNAANSIIRQQQLLDEENLRLQDRIKRLEEAGDALYEGWIGYGFTKDKHLAAWLKAKEAKP